MTIRPRGNKYQVDFMVRGRRVRETFDCKIEAETWEALAKQSLKLGRPLPPKVTRPQTSETIAELVRYVDKHHWTHLSSGHASKQGALFRDYVGPNMLANEALTEDVIEEYLTHREEALGNSGSTINRHAAAISKLCAVAVKRGIILSKPDIRKRREGDARTRVYTPSEEKQILLTLKSWGYYREASFIAVLADTGARVGELVKLRHSDIEGNKIHLRASTTKTYQARTLVLTARALKALEVVQEEPFGPFAWYNKQSFRSVWSRLRTHLDLDDDCVLHTFRHTFASRVVKATGDLYMCSRALGHSSIVTTQRYAK